MSAVVYTCPKNPEQFEAFAQGFKARRVPASAWAYQRDASLHIIGGLQYGSLALLMRARAEGAPYVFFDRAYFGGGPGSGRLRVTFGGYQQHWVNEARLAMPLAYARNWGVKLEPWRKPGAKILLVPPSSAIELLFGLQGWVDTTLARIKAVSDRPVVLSFKSDPASLAQRLADCHCVVTLTSNVAVDAVCAGVHAIVSAESAAAPVSELLLDGLRRIELPRRPDRGAWVASLAWGQFTLAEIRSGFAREVVMEEARCTA